MSITAVSKTLHLDDSNGNDYLTPSGGARMEKREHLVEIPILGLSTAGYGTFKQSAIDYLYFPNASAKPTKIDVSWYMSASSSSSSNYTQFQVAGSSIKQASTSGGDVSVSYTGAGITNSTRSSASLAFYLKSSSSLNYVVIHYADITLHFNRYDFSALAGTGIASASFTKLSATNIFNGVFSPYFNGSCSTATFDGYSCWKTTTSSNADNRDGAIYGSTGMTTGQTYKFSAMVWIPAGKQIRIGVRTNDGGHTEDIYVDGTGGWQYVERIFTATSAMTGQIESVQMDYSSQVYSWYFRDPNLSLQGIYEGDILSFSATPDTGYQFDHWSDGSTENPHTIIVGSSNHPAQETLTAYGISTGKNLSVLHGNSLTVNETVTGSVTVSIGQALGSLPFTLSDGAKTLNAKDKVMQNNVTVGARTLLCKDKIAPYHIPILLCPGSWETNTALNNATSGSSAASGWITTPLLKLPTDCTNITIECGGTHSGYSCLHEFDANGGYLSYWGAANNPRTFTFDYKNSVAYVRATFNMANLANCYIKDNTHNVYVFKGGNV